MALLEALPHGAGGAGTHQHLKLFIDQLDTAVGGCRAMDLLLLVPGTHGDSRALVQVSRTALYLYLAAAPCWSSFRKARRCVWQLLMGVNLLFQILQKFLELKNLVSPGPEPLGRLKFPTPTLHKRCESVWQDRFINKLIE